MLLAMAVFLKEIQADAIDAKVPISNVLRKCAVLAAQLKNNELRDWAFKELNGYPDGEVPAYRVLPAAAQAHLHAAGWEYKATPLASLILPAKLQERANAHRTRPDTVRPVDAASSTLSEGSPAPGRGAAATRTLGAAVGAEDGPQMDAEVMIRVRIALAHLLHDEDEQVRFEAVASLRRFGGQAKHSVPKLIVERRIAPPSSLMNRNPRLLFSLGINDAVLFD